MIKGSKSMMTDQVRQLHSALLNLSRLATAPALNLRPLHDCNSASGHLPHFIVIGFPRSYGAHKIMPSCFYFALGLVLLGKIFPFDLNEAKAFLA